MNITKIANIFQPFSGGVAVNPLPEPAECGTSNFLANGVAWLASKLPTVMGTSVYYRRGNRTTALCATMGQTKLMLADDVGATRIEWTDKDFLIPRSALTINSALTLPKVGDLVIHNDGTETHTYEVLKYGGTEPHWRWSDPFRKIIRVHTKRITTEAN